MLDQKFVDTLPALADAVGSPNFEKRLADTLGAVLEFDFVTMARYSVHTQPRFLIHSHTFPSNMAELYLSEFIDTDPYIDHWSNHEESGVVWLQDLVSVSQKYKPYSEVFLPKIGVKDEIGVFMPALARDSIAFFFNNRVKLFTPEDIRKVMKVFDACAALYRLHIRVLLNGDVIEAGKSPSLGRPMKITDCTGVTVWVTDEWEEQQTPETQLICCAINDEFGSSQRYMWTMVPEGGAISDHSFASFDIWASQIGLTPREKDIAGLVLKGNSSSGIAAILNLSVGNIKNHKRRMYTKLDITSEREIFLMYIESVSLKVV